MKILEEFWYGNIEPTDYDTSSCKEYIKAPLSIDRGAFAFASRPLFVYRPFIKKSCPVHVSPQSLWYTGQ